MGTEYTNYMWGKEGNTKFSMQCQKMTDNEIHKRSYLPYLKKISNKSLFCQRGYWPGTIHEVFDAKSAS